MIIDMCGLVSTIFVICLFPLSFGPGFVSHTSLSKYFTLQVGMSIAYNSIPVSNQQF